MQITIKTLKQESFKVEVEESDKVLTIKEKVEQLQGKILADENPVSQYNITEKDFLVIMVTKAKPAAAPKAVAPAAASSTTTTPVPAAASAAPIPSAPVAQAPVEEAPVAAASAAPVVGENPTPAASAEPTAPTSADNALLTGTHFETAIQNMMEMGFPREQCMNAMRASFNNPDRAVEYLMTGIPENLQAQTSAPAPAAAPRAPAATAASTPAAAAPATATAAQPQNLFTAAAQAAANARRSAETGGAGGDGADSLAFLRDQPQFQQIREMVQANPELLQPLLVQLGQTNPHMLQLINQNQHAFLNLLNEGNEGEDGQPPAGSNHIYVTQEEQEAIQRLESLGFDRQTAVEAFLACDRDEQMAANYLFDHGHDDMDEEFQ
ncbi:UV excision repair protein RAD23 B [Linnemannia exigua]|uniref:UV excision repair protein RAD23 n=1 Tax=Linnemannia exigua TaxID=604196 RepID=A0AAD4DF67_9FUNG|nr:UV excision repair protein RAD23 B [Linnemannia exigua]